MGHHSPLVSANDNSAMITKSLFNLFIFSLFFYSEDNTVIYLKLGDFWFLSEATPAELRESVLFQSNSPSHFSAIAVAYSNHHQRVKL